MAFFLKGIGDATNRINEITPRFDARILGFLNQCAPGVCWNETSRFNIGTINRGVTIGAGMIQVNGYFGMSDTTTTLNVIIPATTQFAMVIAEINLAARPQRFEIRLTNQSTSSAIGLTQNNLFTSPSGIHQVPLYLLTINPNGTITWQDRRIQLTRPQNARHADDATNATNATNLVANGVINNTATATTQTRTNNTTRVATTAFVHSVIDHALRFNPTGNGLALWSGRIQLPDGLIILWRENTGQQQTFTWAFPNACIFVGFAGFWGTSFSSDNATNRNIGINRDTITRTGFSWAFNSGTGVMNNRRYLAIGY
jgi:hypothetical protein